MPFPTTRNSNVWVPLSAAALGAAAYVISSRREKRDLTGRVALITGGSRGLGLELARCLARSGCRLILVARSAEELARASRDVANYSVAVETITCDLTRADEITRMLDLAQGIFGRVDILINNAGEITVGPIDVFSESEFREAMDLMFWAGVRTTLGLMPHMIASGDADIVNITSIGGKIAVPHLLPYVAAKFAMTGFSEGLQAELRPRGVHVLTVAPGLMRTGGHLQAKFAGDSPREYRWFALGAATPGLSMGVSRAAHQIVNALRLRKRELIISAQAQAAARIYGAFPELSLGLLEMVERWILPDSKHSSGTKSGHDLEEKQPALLKALTSVGRRAASSQNQF
jgi:short-subunit dehydrogenase